MARKRIFHVKMLRTKMQNTTTSSSVLPSVTGKYSLGFQEDKSISQQILQGILQLKLPETEM